MQAQTVAKRVIEFGFHSAWALIAVATLFSATASADERSPGIDPVQFRVEEVKPLPNPEVPDWRESLRKQGLDPEKFEQHFKPSETPVPSVPQAPVFEPVPVPQPIQPQIFVRMPKQVAHLMPDDKALALELIGLTNDFLDEVRAARSSRDQFVSDAASVTGLLNQRFVANGAKRRFRLVRTWKLDDDIGLLGAVLADKFSFRYTRLPEDPRPASIPACRKPLVTKPDGRLLYCFDNEPSRGWARPDQVTEDFHGSESIDWFANLVQPATSTITGEAVVHGHLVDEMLALDPWVYGRPLAVLESLQGALGANARADDSFLLEGFRMPDGEYAFAAAAPQSQWELHPRMRELISIMIDYLQNARKSWRTYETVVTREYRPFAAEYFGRLAGILQNYARLEDEANDRLRDYFEDMTEASARRRFGGTSRFAMSEPAATEFRSQNAALVEDLEELRRCARSLGSVSHPNDMLSSQKLRAWRQTLDHVFTSPAFLGIDMLPGLAQGESLPGRYSFYDPDGPYRKGEGVTAVAAPASSLANMPAFGGLILNDCELLTLPPGNGDALVSADTREEQDIRLSASDTALP